jgi:hypothetical protein
LNDELILLVFGIKSLTGLDGTAFIPNSQKWKIAEDFIRKITMFPQLGFSAFTALFGDTVSSGLSYNRLGQGYFKGIRTHMRTSLNGFSKKELAKINEHPGLEKYTFASIE